MWIEGLGRLHQRFCGPFERGIMSAVLGDGSPGVMKKDGDAIAPNLGAKSDC